VTLSNGPGNSQDWVGLYKSGASHSSYVSYKYLGGATNTTLSFSMPSASGTYEFRFFPNDSYTLLAVSNAVSVGSAPPPPPPPPPTGSDTTAPTVSISSPSNGALLSSATYIVMEASDTVGVEKVELWRNNNVLVKTFTTPPYQWKWSLGGKSGANTFQARAFDEAGNVGYSATVTLYNKTLSQSILNYFIAAVGWLVGW
jgi:hypothetical protein